MALEVAWVGVFWLRGRDLNPRPLGYEFEECFLLLLGLSSCSVTYLFLLLGLSCCFVLVFDLIASELLARDSSIGCPREPKAGDLVPCCKED